MEEKSFSSSFILEMASFAIFDLVSASKKKSGPLLSITSESEFTSIIKTGYEPDEL